MVFLVILDALNGRLDLIVMRGNRLLQSQQRWIMST